MKMKRPFIPGAAVMTCIFICACHDTPPRTGVESALRELSGQAQAFLPEGWSALCTPNAMAVRRRDPVRMVNLVNAPPRDKEESIEHYRLSRSFMGDCQITVRLRERPAVEQLADLNRQNAAVAEKQARLENTMRPMPHKFDDYLPSTPEEKRWVDEYKILKASCCEIPQYQFRDYAAYVVMEPPPGMLEFYVQEESQEYERACSAVISRLGPYDAKGPPSQR
jgi:hypothetical protein